MEMNTAVLQYAYRQANRCVDKLAKMGGNQGEREVVMLVPLEELIEDMRAYIQGVSFEHVFCCCCPSVPISSKKKVKEEESR